MIISVTSSIILGVTILTGFLPNNQLENKYLKEGNKAFINQDYDQALETYSLGLEKAEAKNNLTNNIGLAEMKKEDYINALEHLEKESGNYILRGNANYYLGESQQNIKEKIKFYELAIDEYKQGIINEPRDLELKYNYEFVLDKLEQSKEEADNQEENQDQNEENQEEGQDQQSQDGDEEESQDQQSQDNTGEEEAENQENQEQQSQDEEPEDEQGKQGDIGEEAINPEDSGVQQILRLLERQESESLKNNQEVKNTGGEDAYDW